MFARNAPNKIKSFIIKIASALALVLLSGITSYCLFFVYDESISESSRLSKKFNRQIEEVLNSGVNSYDLKTLTNFEWDVVCVYGEEGESIDLKKSNLVEKIGYEPKFLVRSTYYLPYDFSALLFSDSKNKRIRVFHRVNQDVEKLFGQKLFFSDIEFLGYIENQNIMSSYYKMKLNRCYQSIKNHTS